jgi:hypothetical protein
MNKRIKSLLKTFTAQEIETGLLTNQQNPGLQTTTPNELECEVELLLQLKQDEQAIRTSF